MAIYVNDKYRIKRSADFEEQMKYLSQELKIFSSYTQILVVSAVIGYNNKLFVPIKNPASDAVLMQFFSARHKDLIDLIAYAHEKKQDVVSKDDKYAIFESYANGGFPLLVKMLNINFEEPAKNDRVVILENYFQLLLTNGFVL